MIKGFSAHLNTLYAHLEEQDRCAAAAEDGFRCVEIWAPPEPDSWSRTIGDIEQLGLSLATINTNTGTSPEDFGLVGDAAYSDIWRDEFLATLAFARRAKSRCINVLVGGRRQNATRPAQRRCLTDNLDWALQRLEADDPVLLLEPLNGADRRSPILRTADEALSVIADLGSPPQLRLLFDAYHLFQEEDDAIDALRSAAGMIGHVQLADHPGRGEPGTGDLPISEFLTELARTDYDGWIGLEYFPSGREEGPFAWLREFAELDRRFPPVVAS